MAGGETAGPGGVPVLRLRTMSLCGLIDDDIKAAMKAKETEKLSALRMLKSSLKYAVIEKGAATEAGLADAEVITVLRKRIKQCQDAMAGVTSRRPRKKPSSFCSRPICLLRSRPMNCPRWSARPSRRPGRPAKRKWVR